MRLLYAFTVLSLLLVVSCRSDDDMVNTGLLMVNKESAPVLQTDAGLFSDPTVLRNGDTLYMHLSHYRLATDSIVFDVYLSTDGLNWTAADESDAFRSFSGDVNSDWDIRIETPEVILYDDEWRLYYIGYPISDFTGDIYTSEIGLAMGTSPYQFVRTSDEPILEIGGPLDGDALTSPAIVEHNDTLFMLYTGWNNITSANGFLNQTGAWSQDGVAWTKTAIAHFPEVLPTKFENATEVDLVAGPDGNFYLIFSAEGGIALARSSHPFGPWDIYPDYIIESEFDWESGEVVAPTALIEDGKMRIWYTGVVGLFNGASVGYAEIDFPLAW